MARVASPSRGFGLILLVLLTGLLVGAFLGELVGALLKVNLLAVIGVVAAALALRKL